jgi:hypothetical protein
MRERGTVERDVEDALRNYDIRWPAPSRAARPAKIYIGAARSRLLEVYIQRGSSPRKDTAAAREED